MSYTHRENQGCGFSLETLLHTTWKYSTSSQGIHTRSPAAEREGVMSCIYTYTTHWACARSEGIIPAIEAIERNERRAHERIRYFDGRFYEGSHVCSSILPLLSYCRIEAPPSLLLLLPLQDANKSKGSPVWNQICVIDIRRTRNSRKRESERESLYESDFSFGCVFFRGSVYTRVFDNFFRSFFVWPIL